MNFKFTIFAIFLMFAINCFAVDLLTGFENLKNKSVLHKSSGIAEALHTTCAGQFLS